MEPFKIPWQLKVEKSSDFLPVLWRFGQNLADVEIRFKIGAKRKGSFRFCYYLILFVIIIIVIVVDILSLIFLFSIVTIKKTTTDEG